MKNKIKTSESTNEKFSSINPWLGFLIFLGFTVVLSGAFIYISSFSEVVNWFGYINIVEFSTAAGAVAALIVGIVSSYLVYVSFQAQIKFNEESREMLAK